MTKPDYTAFDAELLAQIKAGRNRMALLDAHKPLLEMAKPFCNLLAGYRHSTQPEWRIIDRRLQALRKKGLIRHDGKAWEAVDAIRSAEGGAA